MKADEPLRKLYNISNEKLRFPSWPLGWDRKRGNECVGHWEE